MQAPTGPCVYQIFDMAESVTEGNGTSVFLLQPEIIVGVGFLAPYVFLCNRCNRRSMGVVW